MADMRFEGPINAKEAFYAMASKARLRDIYARARFEREPWYLTDKKIREGRYSDDGSERDEPVGC